MCWLLALQPGEDPECIRGTAEKAIEDTDSGDGVLVLNDLRGGTPFNRSLMLSREQHIIIVVGANLPMLLTLTLVEMRNPTLDDSWRPWAESGGEKEAWYYSL